MTITPITSTISAVTPDVTKPGEISQTEQNFADFITSSISEVNQAQIDGDRAIEDLYTGKAENLHDVMISVEQADISLRMLVQVRNKALQAYEEIMRMQV
jgi:flagellar hook-basal body complex protein FliE